MAFTAVDVARWTGAITADLYAALAAAYGTVARRWCVG